VCVSLSRQIHYVRNVRGKRRTCYYNVKSGDYIPMDLSSKATFDMANIPTPPVVYSMPDASGRIAYTTNDVLLPKVGEPCLRGALKTGLAVSSFPVKIIASEKEKAASPGADGRLSVPAANRALEQAGHPWKALRLVKLKFPAGTSKEDGLYSWRNLIMSPFLEQDTLIILVELSLPRDRTTPINEIDGTTELESINHYITMCRRRGLLVVGPGSATARWSSGAVLLQDKDKEDPRELEEYLKTELRIVKIHDVHKLMINAKYVNFFPYANPELYSAVALPAPAAPAPALPERVLPVRW
jgi:hypothetical protein